MEPHKIIFGSVPGLSLLSLVSQHPMRHLQQVPLVRLMPHAWPRPNVTSEGQLLKQRSYVPQ